jgi:hypothetical protein
MEIGESFVELWEFLFRMSYFWKNFVKVGGIYGALEQSEVSY